jgi:hypothetical protein
MYDKVVLFVLAPPSPLSIVMNNSGVDTVDHSSLHHLHHSHTLPHHHSPSQALHHQHRPGNVSPPLPPPPPPEDEHSGFGRPRPGRMMPIVPDEEDLPGWVPKNYIEKGKIQSVQELVKIWTVVF